jgi:enoyl-CoA hydratase/carnithine racemase|tara:strand:- start:1797 stop:1937 length:141 start_codon:yes stop_codon:yes gene_type:complete
LFRFIGDGRALELLMTGRPVDVTELMQSGLADRLVPADRYGKFEMD